MLFPAARIAPLDRGLGIALALQDGPEDAQARFVEEVADDPRQLQVHRDERLFHALRVRRPVQPQMGALAGERAQAANGGVGPEGPGQQTVGVALLEPRAIQPVALAPRHGSDRVGIDPVHLDSGRLQLVVEGQPVDAGGFPGHVVLRRADVDAGGAPMQGLQRVQRRRRGGRRRLLPLAL